MTVVSSGGVDTRISRSKAPERGDVRDVVFNPLKSSTSFLVSDQRAATASKRRTAAKKPKMTSAKEEQEECGEDEKPKKRRNVHTDEQRRVNETFHCSRNAAHLHPPGDKGFAAIFVSVKTFVHV